MCRAPFPRRLVDGIPWHVDPVLGAWGWRVAARASRIARLNLARGRIPSLYRSPMLYQLDPRRCDGGLPWWRGLEQGALDCEGLTAWRLAERYQREGAWPCGVIRSSPGGGHVLLADEDPSKILALAGRALSGRRAWNADGCQIARGNDREAGGEAGELPAHLDPELLHPALQRVLTDCPEVHLVSGHRPIERQIMLWEQRMGGRGAPRSWRQVEQDFARWWPWVRAESAGEHAGPIIALPGLSPHQRSPATGADLGGGREVLDRCAERVQNYAHRPVRGEHWHFEPRR